MQKINRSCSLSTSVIKKYRNQSALQRLLIFDKQEILNEDKKIEDENSFTS